MDAEFVQNSRDRQAESQSNPEEKSQIEHRAQYGTALHNTINACREMFQIGEITNAARVLGHFRFG
jgi:hypothetical protein